MFETILIFQTHTRYAQFGRGLFYFKILFFYDSESTTNTSMVFEGNGFALLESKEIFKKAFTSVHLTFKTFQKNALLMAIKKNSVSLCFYIASNCTSS